MDPDDLPTDMISDEEDDNTPSEIPNVFTWVAPCQDKERLFLFIYKVSTEIHYDLQLIEDDTAICVTFQQNVPEEMLIKLLNRVELKIVHVEGLGLTTRKYETVIQTGHLLLEHTCQIHNEANEPVIFVSWEIHEAKKKVLTF
jgi:hypothetical protein